MSRKALVIPPTFFPPAPYTIHGQTIEGENHYSISRPWKRTTLPVVFDADAPVPEDFNKYFAECAGEEPEP